MAEAILLTGKRGEGKSITAARMMADYIRAGRVVATNMDINMENMARPWSKLVCYRLPDNPTIEALNALPLGNPNPVNESRNGLLVLDEVGTFLNSRDWQAKERPAVISWLLHSRKSGWDLVLIAQHPRLVDAQIRDALCEVFAISRRADKLPVPLLGSVWKLITGRQLRLPRAHVVSFRYGFVPGSPRLDLWWFSGRQYQNCYDSLQRISSFGQTGLSCYLPAYHLKGRYMSSVQMIRGAAFAALVLGFLLGIISGWLYWRDAVLEAVSDSVVVGSVVSGNEFLVLLDDGRLVSSRSARLFKGRKQYNIGGVWHDEVAK
jgi:hypothetical protein